MERHAPFDEKNITMQPIDRLNTMYKSGFNKTRHTSVDPVQKNASLKEQLRALKMSEANEQSASNSQSLKGSTAHAG